MAPRRYQKGNDLLFVGAMQPGLGIVCKEPKCYRQHRPVVQPVDSPDRAMLSAPVLLPRSEKLCRLHRPYKEPPCSLSRAESIQMIRFCSILNKIPWFGC
jgi:hypothetical protein